MFYCGANKILRLHLFMVKWLKILLKDMCKIHIKDSTYQLTDQEISSAPRGPENLASQPGGLAD